MSAGEPGRSIQECNVWENIVAELKVVSNGQAVDFRKIERRLDLLCELFEEGWDEACASVQEVINVVMVNAYGLPADNFLLKKWEQLNFSQKLSLLCLHGHLNDE